MLNACSIGRKLAGKMPALRAVWSATILVACVKPPAGKMPALRIVWSATILVAYVKPPAGKMPALRIVWSATILVACVKPLAGKMPALRVVEIRDNRVGWPIQRLLSDRISPQLRRWLPRQQRPCPAPLLFRLAAAADLGPA